MTTQGHSQDAPEDDPLEELLADCLERPATEQRDAFETTCRQNPDLAEQLRKRWSALDAMGLVGAANGGSEFPEELDDFKLIRRLGGGGMGVVYLAEQRSLGRQVALKLIRPEQLYFPLARERFRREGEAVARLQHPGIVPIHTVGEAEGVPYFAMELVPGCTLAEVLKAVEGRAPESLEGEDLALAVTAAASTFEDGPETFTRSETFAGTWVDACIALVIQVADALQHAHDRHVLHRDVKPSNVALTADGRALLLDFGLASTSEEGALTRTGSAIGSVPYMSPEQVRSETLDARTDVYSLGVTLYELLTLQVPYSLSDPMALREAIVEGTPDSIRVRNRAVPRDVETVCLLAMDRDRGRRYGSAKAFADDLRNVLELRPIQAKRPGRMLRAQRWVQRNPMASTAIALAFVLVVGLPTLLLWQEQQYTGELRTERDRVATEALTAERVADFLSDLFAAADPESTEGEELTAREMLDSATRRLHELDDAPEVQARLMERIGRAYTNLNLFDEAKPLLERSLEIRREQEPGDSEPKSLALFHLGQLRRKAGWDGAEEVLRETLAMRERLGGLDGSLAVSARLELGAYLSMRGRADEAIEVLREAEASLDPTDAEYLRLRASLFSNLGGTLQRKGDYEASLEESMKAVDAYRQLDKETGVLWSLNTAAICLRRLDRLEEAEAAYDEVLELAAQVYGAGSQQHSVCLRNYAGLLQSRGELERAEAAYREALDGLLATLDPSNGLVVSCQASLGGLLVDGGRWSEARELYAAALPGLDSYYGEDNPRTVFARHNLGRTAWATGRFAEAEESLRGALATYERRDDPYRAGRGKAYLAMVLTRDPATYAEGLALHEEALAFAEANPRHAYIGRIVRLDRARLALAEGRLDEAEAGARAVIETDVDQPPSVVRWQQPFARALLGATLGEQGYDDEAAELLRLGMEELEEVAGREHVLWREAVALCIEHHRAVGDAAEAARLEAELER